MTNDILNTLYKNRAALTINDLVDRLDCEWRTVAKEVNRLYAEGLVYVDGDKRVGQYMHPRWRLTGAGEYAAAQARAQQRIEEAGDDDEA